MFKWINISHPFCTGEMQGTQRKSQIKSSMKPRSMTRKCETNKSQNRAREEVSVCIEKKTLFHNPLPPSIHF
jgi:hypothetical protein